MINYLLEKTPVYRNHSSWLVVIELSWLFVVLFNLSRWLRHYDTRSTSIKIDGCCWCLLLLAFKDVCNCLGPFNINITLSIESEYVRSLHDRRMLIHCSSLVGAPPFLIDRPRTNFCFVVPLLISRVNSRQTVGWLVAISCKMSYIGNDGIKVSQSIKPKGIQAKLPTHTHTPSLAADIKSRQMANFFSRCFQ